MRGHHSWRLHDALHVVFRNLQSGESRWDLTAADGSFLVEGLEPEAHEIVLEAPDGTRHPGGQRRPAAGSWNLELQERNRH